MCLAGFVGSVGACVVAAMLFVSSGGVAQGIIFVDSPQEGTVVASGATIAVVGAVIEPSGAPIPGIDVEMRLLDPRGAEVPGTFSSNTTDVVGSYYFTLHVPNGLADGTYRVRIASSNVSIAPRQVSLVLRSPVVPSGIGPWVGLGIALGAVLAGVAVAAWLAYRARASRRHAFLALCPACGLAVPAGASRCPRCGADVPGTRPPPQ